MIRRVIGTTTVGCAFALALLSAAPASVASESAPNSPTQPGPGASPQVRPIGDPAPSPPEVPAPAERGSRGEP